MQSFALKQCIKTNKVRKYYNILTLGFLAKPLNENAVNVEGRLKLRKTGNLRKTTDVNKEEKSNSYNK
jgi:hypothetical protein